MGIIIIVKNEKKYKLLEEIRLIKFPIRNEIKCSIKNKQIKPDSNLWARIKPIVLSIWKSQIRNFCIE